MRTFYSGYFDTNDDVTTNFSKWQRKEKQGKRKYLKNEAEIAW